MTDNLLKMMLSIKKIHQTNRLDEFIHTREKYLKNYLLILTIAGSGVVLLWAWFDVHYFINDIRPLTGLRLGTVAIYLINLFIAYRRKTDKGYRQHLIIGFYLGTLFCAVLASLTGAFSSNYTYGFLFIIISWLTLIPFSFKKLIIHFGVLMILFNLCVMVLAEFAFNWHIMLETNFIYLGVALVGIAAAFFNNQSAVENFLIKQNIQNTMDQLSHANAELLQTQKVLTESEQKYRLLIEKSMDGIVISQEGKVLLINQAFADILGYTMEEIYNSFGPEAIAPEDRERVLGIHYRRMRGEIDIARYSAWFLKKNGDRVMLELNTTTIQVEGKPASLITIRDMSERIRAEEEIKAAHNKLEEINHNLEETIEARTRELTEANTQLLKMQKENLQSQFDMLKQQVNPHFLFNSLNVLTSLIKLEPDQAVRFTEHLSMVYRYVLENKDNETVKLSTELEFLDAYLFLLNIRFMGKLAVELNVPENKRGKLIIPLALQLLIENAIKHNAMSKKSQLKIKIYVDRHDNLVVLNNLQERENYIVSTGVGLQNIKTRYLLLNQREPVFDKTNNEFIARIPLIN